MAVREYQFIVGPETSSLPAISTVPTDDTDLVNLGHANSHYVQGKASVANPAAVKAISDSGTEARVDNDCIYVDSLNCLFSFDAGSSATGDDDFVITPTSGTGRWIRETDRPDDPRKMGEEASTPANPVTGTYKLYFKSDGLLYQLDAAGVEQAVADASGGQHHLFTNNSIGNVTVLTGKTAFHAGLDVQSGHTYTVNSGGSLVAENLVVSSGGTVTVSSGGRLKVL